MIAVGFRGKITLPCLLVAIAALSVLLVASSSSAAAGTVVWAIRVVPEPTYFSHSDTTRCEKNNGEQCDRYQLLAMDVGDEASTGPITVTDTLPPGISTAKPPESQGGWICTVGKNHTGQTEVTCTNSESVAQGRDAYPITIFVTAPSASSGSLKNEASITGGGTEAVVAASEETQISSQAPPFGLSEFSFEANEANGAKSTGAGVHPWAVTTSLEVPLVELPVVTEEGAFGPVESLKDVVVELPMGFTGDPQAAPKCAEADLEHHACPPGSSVGSVELGAEGSADRFVFSHNGLTSALYNMVPEDGYPAEFGFVFQSDTPIYLYASVVHTDSGYRLRVGSPGLPDALGPFGGVFTFYGEPAKVEGEASEAAFLTNPTHCTTEPQTARAEVESWENPGHPVSKEATVYPELAGCNLLLFNPSLTLAPSPAPEGTTQADEPSGYTVDLKLPQNEAFSELATPELEDATVTLPEGVSASPSAADGLQACSDAQFAASSTEPSACPLASQVATVTASTPVLPGPVTGQVFVGAPLCGEPTPCTEEDAQDGRMVRLFMQVSIPGATLKFPGTVTIDPATGRLTGHFEGLIQQPLSDVKMRFKGGPRAPLANPQSCGAATTTSDLTPWSSPANPDATPTSSFNVDWDGNGGACPASLPFAPTFDAGPITPTAGGFSPFTLTLSRHDREQDLSGITVNTPPGLLAMLSEVPLCPEPQAGAGTCSEASLIGHTQVAAGAGSHPFWVGGSVYLTGPYGGAPFGLSIVTHAQAGPFNLGNVIVRAAIHIDPHTGAASVVSNPLPQIVDGIPLRIQTVSVTLDRPGFTFNPTNCSQLQTTGTISATQGASANVSSPFEVAGCKTLPFKPKFSVSTKPRTSKIDGTSLHVAVTAASGQANIASVHVELPKKLPSRLTTLHNACPAATFNANPSSCPAASDVGTATATTPVLSVPLTGPAYLVSHGGAAFPDLVVVLQGEGVLIELTGATDIKKGITSSTFSSLPDAPISHFELLLPQGSDSVLTVYGNICKKPLEMPTVITGQNGARIKKSTRIAVSGCPKHRRRTKKARK